MKLRPYDAADEDALAAVWFESWRSVGLAEPAVVRSDLAARTKRELSARWDVTVAEEDGRVVGFLAIAPEERRLDQLFVLPEMQGRGIGRALFNLAAAKMRDGFWLSTQLNNHRARDFYTRRGMILDRVEGDAEAERAVYIMRALGT